MDFSKKYDTPSPEDTANPISRLFFIWILPFFKFGYQNDLQLKDLYNCAKPDLSGPLGDQMEKNWEAEVKRAKRKGKKPSLLRTIRKSFLAPFSKLGILFLMESCVVRMLKPVVLAAYIRYFDPTTMEISRSMGWLLATGVVFIGFVDVVLMHHCNLSSRRIGMRCMVGCCSLIYRKLLKLSRTSLGQVPVGKLVNLLSNDVQRFDMASQYLHYIWVMPIMTAIAFYIMYNSVGWAALSGLGAITIQAVPLQGYLSKLQGQYRFLIAQKTDNRVKVMNEITSGIQVIKMYAWEKPFEKVVELARKHEIDIVAKTSYIKGFSVSLFVFTERATLFLTVITYVLMGNRLTGDVVFSLAQIFNTVQLYMVILYPLGVSSYAEAKTSVNRIEEFLTLEENAATPSAASKEVAAAETNGVNSVVEKGNLGSVEVRKACASWIPNPIVDTLMNLDVTIKPGTLVCVVGSVGAGKSSFLQMLLKELPLNSGSLKVSGTVSYASQEPWLFVSTIRNNILFGQPYLKNRYRDVTRACALERDFEQLPHGDKTLVGERGASLSGGQKARVNLARSVYREADIYLFDDPLSAVDTHVGKHLFEECLLKYLGGKTRVLVTHQLQFLRQAELIIVLNNGKIEKMGTFNDMSENELNTLNQDHHHEEAGDKEATPEVGGRMERLLSVVSKTSTAPDDDDEVEAQETQELMEKGAIPTSTYMEYYRAGGNICMLLFVLFLFIIAQAACNAGDLWVTHWTNKEEERYAKALELNSTTRASNGTDPEGLNSTGTQLLNGLGENGTALLSSGSLVLESFNQLLENATSSAETLATTAATTGLEGATEGFLTTTIIPGLLDLQNASGSFSDNATNLTGSDVPGEEQMLSQSTYIWVYTVLIILSIVLTSGRSLLFYKICMNASKRLHNKMFSNVLQATMRFFDTNPSGRILNRFSKDMGAVDELLPRVTIEAVQVFLVMTGILAMVFIVSPWMVAPAIVLGGLFYWFRVVYLASAQDVKRLEGIARAPVFSHVSASLYGLPTIRSANAQEMIIAEFDALQNQHTSSMFLFMTTSEAFGFFLDVISSVFLAIVTYQFLIIESGSTLSGNVGLVISQSLILTGMLQYGTRQAAEISSNMTSVERVLQYTKLDKEGPFESLPTKKPSRDWPQRGKISFRNVYLKYIPEEPPVLKNLNIEIEAAQKIGIVGRTGAGKSTLMAALFRLAKIEGVIEIDNVNTQFIGLTDLRSKISIIPQEPILFSNTLRYNLDPFGKCDDKTLWQALENVELKDAVDSLDQRVNEGGSNFSAGQRQLLCLARAVVRSNRILVMDEATANVDPTTDALIQTSIRRNFKDCTVLTIAHRLNTIMDSDKVLVMEAGEAVEFAHPYELLQNPEGHFTKMLKEMGPLMVAKLHKIAKDDHSAKFPSPETNDNDDDDDDDEKKDK